MSHSHHRCIYHIVFSTAKRLPTINPAWMPRMWAYLAGAAENLGAYPYRVGSTENHAHLCLAIPPKDAVADLVRQIKACSSKWVHEDLRAMDFEWQRGYGAFTIGVSQIAATIAYFDNQEAHHRTVSFEDEYRAFLEKNGIEIDAYAFD